MCFVALLSLFPSKRGDENTTVFSIVKKSLNRWLEMYFLKPNVILTPQFQIELSGWLSSWFQMPVERLQQIKALIAFKQSYQVSVLCSVMNIELWPCPPEMNLHRQKGCGVPSCLCLVSVTINFSLAGWLTEIHLPWLSVGTTGFFLVG